MKKFLTVSSIILALLLGAGGLAIGAYNYMQAFTNQKVETVDEQVETDLSKVAGYTPDQDKGDLVAELMAANTQLIWETGKFDATGKRYDFDGTWTSFGGAVVYDAKDKALKALEVKIVIESFNSYSGNGYDSPAPGGVINGVLGKGKEPPTGYDPWFNHKDHPMATFTATEFVPKADGVTTDFKSAPEGWTHLIKGEFDLNGTKNPLEIPAVVKFEGKKLVLDAKFEISREAYGVAPKNYRGSKVDDIIEITTSFAVEPDKGDQIAALSESMGTQLADLSRKIDGLKGLIALKDNDIKLLQSSLDESNKALASLQKKVAAGISAAPEKAVDVSKLEKKFTEKLTYPKNEKTSYPGKGPLAFDMVLVPGDSAAGIKPFYMAATEVTWEMFYDWAYSSDIDPSKSAGLQKKNLRPSPLYEDCDQLKLGLEKRPALSMSRTTAEAYAKWVSERTGKTYRLPTDKEWQLALKLGGGVPTDQDTLYKQAVLEDNAKEQDAPPFLAVTNEVGTTQPNKLGIYDMLGNAAEWVTDTGAKRIVRGGHFKLPASELNADWSAQEDQPIWNETYPQLPVSRFWYRDHYYQGIRLVCEVE